MLQNAKVTVFTVSELLRENQLGGKITPPPRLVLTYVVWINYTKLIHGVLKHLKTTVIPWFFLNLYLE